jgi:cytochrome c2
MGGKIAEPDVEVPEGNVKKGAKLFKSKCAQCHTQTAAEGHKQGPNLWKVRGRPLNRESSNIKESIIIH